MRTRNLSTAYLTLFGLIAVPTFAQVEVANLGTGGGDQLGIDLILRGDMLVAGAIGDSTQGVGAGAAFVYVHDDRGTPGFAFDDSWIALQQLAPGELSAGDAFGSRVELSGDVLVIGAPYRNELHSDSGAVYVYLRQRNSTPDPLDDSWVFHQKLLPSTSFSGQRFGREITIEASTIGVGMRDDTNPNNEEFYLFERNRMGTPLDPFDDVWVEATVLVEPPQRQRFGWAADLTSDTLIVGARWHDLTASDDNSGVAYVYYRDQHGTVENRLDDTWLKGPVITALVPQAHSEFGRQVELTGDTLVVTAHHAFTTGAAYFFERDRKGTPDPLDDEWLQTSLVAPSDGAAQDLFGEGVALGSDVCAIGAPQFDAPSAIKIGKVYLYERDDNGTPANPLDDSWNETARLIGSSSGADSRDGLQVSMNAGVLAVGARLGAILHFYDLDGELCLDAESEDDWQTPLLNGQIADTATTFGRWLRLDGFSSSGHEAVCFDSSPKGPNSTGTDPDLLVGKGNLLILQELPGQSVPGFYDVPDDDADGGLFEVDFMQGVATPLSIDLIDVDLLPDQDVSVTLFDSVGSTRTYLVPSGWTRDISMDGAPGYRSLDLTTLAPQPGFMATALATEGPGFDSSAVVRMQIRFAGSAALDELRWRVNGSSPPYASSTEGPARRLSQARPAPALTAVKSLLPR